MYKLQHLISDQRLPVLSQDSLYHRRVQYRYTTRTNFQVSLVEHLMSALMICMVRARAWRTRGARPRLAPARRGGGARLSMRLLASLLPAAPNGASWLHSVAGPFLA